MNRLVRKAARACLIALSIFVVYFADYFVLYWLAGRGIVDSRPFRFVTGTIFSPIEWFASSSHPTTPYIRATAEWCYSQGSGGLIPWNELFAYWEAARTGKPIPPPRPLQVPDQ